MEEYGNLETDLQQDDQPKPKRKDKDDAKIDDGAGPKKADTALMQLEERNVGAVTWSVYYKYLGFAGSVAWAPLLLSLLTLSQVAQGSIPGFAQGDYIAVYALLGEDWMPFLFTVLN